MNRSPCSDRAPYHTMKPRIEVISEKKLIGKHLLMSFTNDKTGALWRSFMPGRKEILNNIGAELFSIEVYDLQYFTDFNPAKEFEKWAAVEVTDPNTIPGEMESIILPGGRYAVFIHKGAASEGPKTYRYIFETWLPGSGFQLDHRPHFAIMGEKYKKDDPGSEEEIWIPIKK